MTSASTEVSNRFGPIANNYRGIELEPALNRKQSVVYGISGSSFRERVALGATENANGDMQACTWRNGSPKFLEKVESYSASEALAINQRGSIIGRAGGHVSNEKQRNAILWNGDDVEELLGLDGDDCSEATAINEKGFVAGVSFHSQVALNRRPILWFDGNTIPVELPAKYQFGEIRGLNSKIVACGNVFNSTHDSQPVLWIKNKANLITVPDAVSSTIVAISDKGHFVGVAKSKAASPQYSQGFAFIGDASDLISGRGDVSSVKLSKLIRSEGLSVSDDIYFLQKPNGLAVLINTQAQAGAEKRHFPIVLKGGDVQSLANATPIDLNSICPRLPRISHLHQVCGISEDGAMVGFGFSGSQQLGILLEPMA